MKNPDLYLRTALGNLLGGAVSYNSAVVPVYGNDEYHLDTLQIVIGEYSDADASNKSNFQGEGTQVIEVISEQPTGAKKKVDEVGELVMNVIKPTVQSSELLSDSTFQVMIKGKPTVRHLIEQSGVGNKIVRLLMTYNFLIIER